MGQIQGRKCAWVALGCLLAASPAHAGGILDEVRLGVLGHDIGLGVHHREDGVDLNGELLFAVPPPLDKLGAFAPRPHLGVTVNSGGKNSFVYGGLTWTLPLGRFFGNLGFGGAVHDGPDQSVTDDHKGLGTRFLFHESLELGWRLTADLRISFYLEHVSNADTGTHNPGLTNAGLRMGFTF